MVQVTSGWRSVLSLPKAYAGFQRAISRPSGRRLLIERYLSLSPETRLLDIGCANGRFLEQLPEVQYVGFDPSEEYITAARSEHGDRGEFLVGTTETIDTDSLGRFDVVVARGVLHHIEDSQVSQLAEFASRVLQPSGVFATLDPTRLPDQRRIARFLIDRDRGQNIREPEQYRDLVAPAFVATRVDLYHRLLRVPYDHAVVTARLT